jgi:glucose/arabinose dehydrogenase
MLSRVGKIALSLAVAGGLTAATAGAAGSGGPSTPSGKPAQVVASNVFIPTSFAWGDGQMFWSDGTPSDAAPVGGVYYLKDGVPTKIPGSPAESFGVAWHKGKLYVSGGTSIQAWSGWNGTTFSKQKTIYTGPKGANNCGSKGSKGSCFPGFNGLAFGADGRLYVGVDVGNNDHGPATAPYQYDVLSMTASGKKVKVFASGMRQPWQLAFAKGSSHPYVSDLGQDAGAKNPPDFLLKLKQGQDYGFPKCNWTKASACRKFAKPFETFSPHTDAMGLGILSKRLFISEFGGKVVSTPLSGGKQRTELSGFPKGSNIVGLGVHGGWVYVAQIATGPTSLGTIYRFKP